MHGCGLSYDGVGSCGTDGSSRVLLLFSLGRYRGIGAVLRPETIFGCGYGRKRGEAKLRGGEEIFDASWIASFGLCFWLLGIVWMVFGVLMDASNWWGFWAPVFFFCGGHILF